jgi:UDP-N-acetylmuramoyl-tripeptide--D-alanyl-D-alanine ligase
MTAGLLALFARLVVRKYKPRIIMVTGSVGKTSTKDATAAALHSAFFVRKSEKSYNSEFGMPLTILGAANPWTNVFGWLRVCKEALALLVLPNHYPKVLVLEVGAGRPGDLARILRIAVPDAVIVTRLPEVPVHVEAYASPSAVREEEFAPAYALAPGCPLIICTDDPFAVALSARLDVKMLTYGLAKSADVRLVDTELCLKGGRPIGMCAKIRVGDEEEKIVVHGALGEQQLLPAAAAVAGAIALGLSLSTALAGLASYEPPPGRTRLLEGREGSVLVDDSYNASPAAVEEGLKALNLIAAKRHIAVLADMLELGRYSVAEHERIGALATEHADIIIAVGIRSRALASSARVKRPGNEESVLAFDTAREAVAPLRALVSHGDALLIKGSQSMRMERLVEALLSDPLDAAKLVRQDKEWKRKL